MSLAQSREEQTQADAEMKEAATYPYRRCIEEVHGLLRHNRDNLDDLCEMDPDNRTFRAVRTALDSRLELLDAAIDKYEIRDELDL